MGKRKGRENQAEGERKRKEGEEEGEEEVEEDKGGGLERGVGGDKKEKEEKEDRGRRAGDKGREEGVQNDVTPPSGFEKQSPMKF